MANTFVASRVQLIYALCLPLAVLLGYFLADPMDPGSILMVFLVIALLITPVLMRCHHILLILTWNAAFAPYFIPGQPFLWMLVAFVSLGFAVISRFTNPDAKFVWVNSISKPLLFLGLVVVVTAWLRGGIGLQSFGAQHSGGKGYVYLLASIAGYFALSSRRIPIDQASLWVGLFFVSGITALVPNLAYLGGRSFDFLYYFFPALYALEQAVGDYSLNTQFTRLYGIGLATVALFCWLLARHGFRGLFNWKRPWRFALLLLAFTGCFFSGFRTQLALFIVLVPLQLYFEGLFRPRVMIFTACALLLVAAVGLPNASRLPHVVQRTISFLPVDINPAIRISAEVSAEWRWLMWQDVVPLVPQYWLLGKGYALNPTELAFAAENSRRGYGGNYGTSLAAGDYHNGLLTLVIPLGIWGAAGFAWFALAGVKYLYKSYLDGDPALKAINTFLLAFFVARLAVFFTVFGSFYNDLFVFTGILGLSVSLNGAKAAEAVEVEVQEEPEELTMGHEGRSWEPTGGRN